MWPLFLFYTKATRTADVAATIKISNVNLSMVVCC